MRLALVLLVGCDAVYNLRGRTEDVDAGPAIHVTGALEHVLVSSDLSHAPISRTTALDEELDLPIVTSFGAVIPVAWEASTGTFAFDASPPYEIRVGVLEWQSSSPELRLQIVSYGRPTATLAGEVTLEATLSPPPTASHYELVSTGVWSRQQVATVSDIGFTHDWTQGPFYGTPPRLLSSAAGDSLILAGFTPTPQPGMEVMTQVGQTTIEMTEGPQPVEFALVPAPPIGCAHVVPTAKTDIMRLGEVYPELSDPRGGWKIEACPLAETFGLRIQLPLAYQFAGAGAIAPLDAMFPNPYVGHSIVLSQESSLARMLDGRELRATMASRQLLLPGPCALTSIAPTVPLPVDPKLANVSLANDGLTLAIPDRAYADLTWKTDGGASDLYVVDLFEVPKTMDDLVVSRRFVTTEPRVRVATSLFSPSLRYLVRITTETPNPSAATGDFTAHPLPMQTADVFTSAFTLVN